MRPLRASLPIALLLLATLPSATQARSAPARDPACASGPERTGDTIVGTPCADVIVAPPGVEVVKGGGGNDTIVAAPVAAGAECPEGCRLGVGSQIFEGGPGDDVVFGERGNDILRGGEGNDRLYGGIGDDLLEGGPGDDLLSGGFGADAIDGGPGDDYVRGDGTQDEIVDTGPSTDVDTLSYSTGVTPGFTRPIPIPAHAGFPDKEGERGVYLDLSANLADNGVAPNGGGVDKIVGSDFERIIGSPFSDYIVGAQSTQEIFGGGGADVLIADPETRLDGGADGDDCVGGASVANCESTQSGGPVVMRDPGKVSIGLMTPGEGAYTQLYLTGSNLSDRLTATYESGPPAAVAFTLEGGSGAMFDQTASEAAGCEVKVSTEAVCPLEGPLDSVLIAGLGGDDVLDGGGLPATTSLVALGGEGNDEVSGDDESDDTLADGPGDDVLRGRNGDDALLNNAGRDELFGEGGNDLLLSNSICDGDLLDGGQGRDNASWAKFKQGVEVRLDLERAGDPGAEGMPQCGGGQLDTVEGVEDLEGTRSGDVLYGDAGSNQLLGHLGPDTYFSGAGEDSILANSGDYDPVIDCGDDVDTAIIDRPQYGDVAAPDCENVFEADPNNFRTLTRLAPAIAPPPPAPPPDTTPPRTRIAAHPPKSIRTRRSWRRVVFRFASSERGSRFRCKLDRKPYRSCTSPRAYTVALGRHRVRIVAIDPSGNADPTPASFGFRVRRASCRWSRSRRCRGRNRSASRPRPVRP
jgi:Ca2+-binding RTX toxin-like protein